MRPSSREINRARARMAALPRHANARTRPMMRTTRSLRLSAFVLFALGTSALAGPAEDLSKAAIAALPGLQLGSGAVGESRDEGGAAVLANVTLSSAGDRPVGVKIATVTVTGGIGATDALSNSRVVLQGVEGTGPTARATRSSASRSPARRVRSPPSSAASRPASPSSRAPTRQASPAIRPRASPFRR